jgi:hypothetical protein
MRAPAPGGDRSAVVRVAAIAALLMACQGPRVEIEWTGADTGAAVLPATATRCGAGPVELTAIAGDTGVGIVIHGATPLATGRYPLTGPNEAASSPPAAALAARWPDSTDLHAFRTAEGALELTATDKLRGTFTGRAERWGGGAGEITISGAIVGVRVGPCPAGEPAADTVPSQ